MEVIHKISLDLCCPEKPVVIVPMVQGDNCRKLEITVTDHGKPAEIPENTEVYICYANAETSGSYKTIEKDGVVQNAYAFEGNVITVAISESVTEHAGLGSIGIRFAEPGTAGMEVIHAADLSAGGLPVWGIEDVDPDATAEMSRRVYLRKADWEYLVHRFPSIELGIPNVYPGYKESFGCAQKECDREKCDLTTCGRGQWILERNANTGNYKLLSTLAEGWRLIYDGNDTIIASASVGEGQTDEFVLAPASDIDVPDDSKDWLAPHKTLSGYVIAAPTDGGYAVLSHSARWRKVMGAMPSIDIQCFCKPCEDCWDGNPPGDVYDQHEWFAVGHINPADSYDRYLPY